MARMGANGSGQIEELVARARAEIVAVDGERFLGGVARLVDDGDGALLAEGRIGEDHVVVAVLPSEGVLGDDGQIKSGRESGRAVSALFPRLHQRDAAPTPPTRRAGPAP